MSISKKERVENYIKTVEFKNPRWVPCRVGIMPATWRKYREELEEIILSHPKIFPDYKRGCVDFDSIKDPGYRLGGFTDSWGCVWDNVAEGLEGIVVRSPLERWEDLDSYTPPDPITQGERGSPIDWENIERYYASLEENEGLPGGGLPHGFMYMRLYYLRGFENFMIDIATDDPRLERLISMVLEYNIKYINKLIEIGAKMMYFGDDLGTQKSLAIHPEKWRKYLKPCYKKMFSLCKDKNIYVYFHSDGHILEIADDLIECGIDIINLQSRANTFDGIKNRFKGKVCIEVDLDRQLFPFATTKEIREHIKEAIEKLYSDKGGLMLYAECEPDVPLENIEAICSTLEEVGGPSL